MNKEEHPLRPAVPGHLLQFEEKIFGMTLPQLLLDLLVTFGCISLSAGLPLVLRIIVCSICILACLILVHTRVGDETLLMRLYWFTRLRFLPNVTIWRPAHTRVPKGEPGSVQDAWLPVTFLEQGIMGQIRPARKAGEQSSSSFWAILEIKSLHNVALLPEQEQIRLYGRFKAFLDGLSFPLKLLTVVLPGDPEHDQALSFARAAGRQLEGVPHLARLHQAQLATQRSMLTRSTTCAYYLVVAISSREVARSRSAEEPSLLAWQRFLGQLMGRRAQAVSPEMVKQTLANRVSVVRKALTSLDVHVHLLNDREVLQVFASCLCPGAERSDFLLTSREEKTEHTGADSDHQHPITHWIQSIRGMHGRLAWRSTKKRACFEAGSIRPSDVLAPSQVRLAHDAVEVDVRGQIRYVRSYEILGYGSSLAAGWLSALTELALPMMIMTRLEPLPRRQMIKKLEMDLTKLESQKIADQKTLKVMKSAHLASAEQSRTMMDALERHEISIFAVQLVITLHAGSRERLRERAEYLLSHLRDLQLRSRELTLRHDLGWQACLPADLGGSLTSFVNLPSPALATFMHWKRGVVGSPKGVFLGTTGTALSLRPIYWNPWDESRTLANPHLCICGESGMGKSWLVKLIVLGLLSHQIADVVILDRDGDYRAIADYLGEETCQRFNLAGTIPINLLTLPYGPADAHREEKTDLLAEGIENHVLIGLALLYGESFTLPQEAFLVTVLRETYARRGITTEAIWHDPDTLLREPPVFADLLTVMRELPAPSKAVRLSLLERFEHVAYLFAHETPLSLEKPLTIFDTQRLDRKWYPLMTYVVQTYLMRHRALRRKSRYLAYVVEEASHLLKHEAGKRALEQIRGFRKRGIAQIVVSQHPDDFLQEGQIILANSATHVLLGMGRQAAEQLRLPEPLQHVLEAEEPGRAVIRCGREAAALDVSRGSFLHRRIMTTDPIDERQQDHFPQSFVSQPVASKEATQREEEV